MSGDLATSLREVWDAKKNLRHTLKVPRDIPFNKYIDYYPWLGEDILEDGLVYDFTRNRYSQEGVPVLMGDISEVIRLSSATKWHDGQLVEVGDNIPRISGDGLLIEKSSTELIPNNSSLTSLNTAWTATQKTDAQIGSVFEFVSDGSNAAIRTNVPQYPAGNVAADNGYYYRSVLAKKTDVDSYFLLGSDSGATRLILNLRDGVVDVVGSLIAQHKVTLIGHYYLIESLTTEIGATERQFALAASNNRGTTFALALPTAGHKTTVALPSFRDTADFPQSFVKTSGTQVTRSPDILNIPLLPSQTFTGDWDAGVTYEVADNIATFTGHGYIHSITVKAFTPYLLFIDNEKGFWADPSDTSTLFQNADGTIAVVDGDPIGLVLDKTGNNYNLTQTVSASRPKLLNGGIVFDRVDDSLELEVPEGGITGTLFLATTRGTASYGVSMPAGVWTLGSANNPLGDVVSAVLVDRVLSEDEKARLHVFGVGKGGTEFGTETIFTNAYRAWTHLVDFPMIDTSKVAAYNATWYGCQGLTSFPSLDVSSGERFDNAWSLCINLATFPANFFDNCSAINFSNAFRSTNLSEASIDGILVSINSNGTSNGTFDQFGGSAPSVVGQAAIDAMRSRGWTVTVTGGY